MRKQNKTIIGAFLDKKPAHSPIRDYEAGYYMARGASISTDGGLLYSYETPIAIWRGRKVIADMRKYSPTTSRQQADLRYLCSTKGVELVEGEASIKDYLLARGVE